MSDEIERLPRLPSRLQEAASVGKLIPFVGAGASRLAGCPNWGDFAHASLEFFVKRGKFTYGQLNQIASLHPRIKLSIALQLQKEHQILIDFRELLYQSGSPFEPGKGRRLYGALSQLGKTFVTTNYDEWLDKTVPFQSPIGNGVLEKPDQTLDRDRAIFHKVTDLTPANLLAGKEAVIHLHGSVRDPGGMIMTTRHYLEHYRNDRAGPEGAEENGVLTFLENLFSKRNVLFVGYGLEELEILEYVILKARAVRGEVGPHYLLQGFFSHEHQLMMSLKAYYRECGIELIPFLKDEKNWDQLIDVLEDFARQAPATTPMQAQRLIDMEGLLDA